jgi:hypothetical protein
MSMKKLSFPKTIGTPETSDLIQKAYLLFVQSKPIPNVPDEREPLSLFHRQAYPAQEKRYHYRAIGIKDKLSCHHFN